VPHDFTLEAYKGELGESRNRTAKEGWEYLIKYGISEPEIFEAVKLVASNELDSVRDAYLRTRIKPRQVRDLGKQLRKRAELLERVNAQYPDLLPAFVGVPQTLNRLQEFQLETRLIPDILKAVSTLLSKCRGRASDFGEATVRKGRVAAGSDIAPGLNLLHLFDRAAADFYSLETGVRLNPLSTELPPAPKAEKVYAWAAELLNLACRLAGHREVFFADNLRKMQEERRPL